MIVLVIENARPGLRGELGKWLVEIKAGVFCGHASARVRDAIWDHVLANMSADCHALLVHNDPGEQRMAIRETGSADRYIKHHEGLQLARRAHADRRKAQARVHPRIPTDHPRRRYGEPFPTDAKPPEGTVDHGVIDPVGEDEDPLDPPRWAG